MYWLFLFYGFKASFVSFITHVHKNRLFHQFNFNNNNLQKRDGLWLNQKILNQKKMK